MRVFLRILKENTKNHSSGKIENCIELLRFGGGSNPDRRTCNWGYRFLRFCHLSLLLSVSGIIRKYEENPKDHIRVLWAIGQSLIYNS